MEFDKKKMFFFYKNWINLRFVCSDKCKSNHNLTVFLYSLSLNQTCKSYRFNPKFCRFLSWFDITYFDWLTFHAIYGADNRFLTLFIRFLWIRCAFYTRSRFRLCMCLPVLQLYYYIKQCDDGIHGSIVCISAYCRVNTNTWPQHYWFFFYFR